MNTDIGDLFKNVNIRDPLLLGSVGALLVALVVFGFTLRSYRAAVEQRDALEHSYEGATQAIDQVKGLEQANPEVLGARVSEKQQELADLLAGFPTTDQATGELARYYDYATECGTQLIRMDARLTSAEEQLQSAYEVETFTLEARGEPRDLMRFWIRLASGPYRTFALYNLSIAPDGPAIGDADLAVVYSDLASRVEGLSVPVPQD